jgi:hypothetical protein
LTAGLAAIDRQVPSLPSKIAARHGVCGGHDSGLNLNFPGPVEHFFLNVNQITSAVVLRG